MNDPSIDYTADYHFDLVGNRMKMGEKTYQYDQLDRIEQEQDPLASRLKLYSWEGTEQAGRAYALHNPRRLTASRGAAGRLSCLVLASGRGGTGRFR